MCSKRDLLRMFCLLLVCLGSSGVALAQRGARAEADAEFGPVVRAYLGYLRNEQEVVDDRVSRHEVSAVYYRRNSNRIRALREVAIRIARETGNDYLPELEAAARDELHTLFETPPRPNSLRVGAILNNTFRYLGSVRAGEIFYIFARLDPYEQADLIQKQTAAGRVAAEPQPTTTSSSSSSSAPVVQSGHQATGRPLRATT